MSVNSVARPADDLAFPPDAITRAYRKARLEAAKKTGLDLARFPDACSYGPAEIAGRPFGIDAPPSP